MGTVGTAFVSGGLVTVEVIGHKSGLDRRFLLVLARQKARRLTRAHILLFMLSGRRRFAIFRRRFLAWHPIFGF